ncbi:hypothetical protein [Frankia sp. Cppng1_Ct_nod]|uniref:WD40 repeat domain-containing protein n=1 Tax=Frankia sp. Cppng1_Ct_nod TaxID=2897162 RepID=UPI001041AA1C|nr:hypothetical protein [Frankia sp. Cppng1_Ct_nod]
MRFASASARRDRAAVAQARRNLHEDLPLEVAAAALKKTSERSPGRETRGDRRPQLPAGAVVAALVASLLLWRVVAGDGATTDRAALSRRLAVAASGAAKNNAELARRLAVAAYRTAPTTEARAGVLRLFASTDRPLTTFEGHGDTVRHVIFSPDGKLLASGEDSGAICLWDAAARGQAAPVAAFLGHVGSPNGKLLATGSRDKTAKLWDTSVRGTIFQPLATFAGHSAWLSSLAINPAGTLLATSSDDKKVMLWNLDAARLAADACAAGHRLTRDEWTTTVPNTSYLPPCP